MAKNRRKVYGEELDAAAATDGIPCTECGCRHSYVVRTAKMDEVIRRTRRCRYCGREFYTTESS